MTLTPYKTAQARAMYQAGKLSVAAIAVALHTDPLELIALARDHGWRRRGHGNGRERRTGSRMSAERMEQIRAAYEESPLTIPDIMDTLKVSKQTIYCLVFEYRWTRRNGAPKAEPRKRERTRSGKKSHNWKAGKHHFNGFHGTNAVATDARTQTYPPHLLSAIKLLQRNDFAVFRQGRNFMVGTKIMDEDGLLAKAARYERRAA